MIKLLRFIDLHNGEDAKEKVLENVTSNISFRGSNLWILACAIVVASVGLNVNSTAVIIGAMLISPLMGPIVGAGFALGTYDFALLKKSLKNLLIATLVSLSVSFIYFLLSPFKDAQSELLARTSPNIYDVLIAFFGGLVGVIAITRVEKGNPIPGVAIATALMPPLCTAGYGLAIGNLSYFAGALYLYSINCFFICISTFFIVKYLKYPKVKFVDKGREKRITRTITLLIMVMIIPSFYLAYVLLQQKKYTQLVDHFINTELVQKGYTVVYEKTSFNSNPKKIELAFLSRKFTPEEIKKLNLSLSGYGIFNTQLIIRQDSTDLKKDILEEINKRSENLSQKDIAIRNLNNELAMYKFDDPKLINEIDILFPEIKVYSVGKQLHVIRQDSTVVNTVLLYEAESPLSDENKSKLQTWLGSRINDPHIEIVRR
ncbi:DUF389 domain-containing protein [Sphingobacterium spiritivorum]|uniref:Hydrophobic domain protein n=1 Tax=Sphingobacterium spiritivorum ATCC 33861 TaxID=525373 RepID=D7VQM1_SPHSI|nr:DUF389 domain-containing protein [Sphingobacterium spiritivorum]EFK56072.1 hydrophobic domain protein [Sphingobacterium spiritivorum ATCC 33861]QQT35806.1 DUF389 domain-containing protein [Sphingobacterium spiritivorum]WQD32528.1 DUF389 domain-containing protein [Sphingobacterium spiritivorum]SUJ10803.1 Uncharacterized protein conserved in bacteria [Sphingobacterium spiritivorum]